MGLNVTIEGEEGDLRPVQHDLLRFGGLRGLQDHSAANFGALSLSLYRPPIDPLLNLKILDVHYLICINKHSGIIRKEKTFLSFVLHI